MTPARDGGGEGDTELLRRTRQGDLRAFERLVERHHAKVFQLVRGIISDWHLSEDVTQEVFATVHRKASTFREEAAFSTWVYRIAVHAAVRARSRRRRLRAEAMEALEGLEAPDGGAARRLEGSEVLRKLLEPLPEKLRAPVLLKEVGGLCYDEIAQVLGCSRGAVEQRIHRAMILLRRVWKDHESRFRMTS